MNIVNYLSKQWEKCNLNKGDFALIHSNTKPLLRHLIKKGYKPTIDDIFRSFLEVVGERGTVIFPTFNFEFPKSKIFDIVNTPSKMGALSEHARCQKDAIRTAHPFYSFVAFGFHKDLFYNLDNISGYGQDSPFKLLRKLNGKIGVLGLEDQSSMTFYHHVEETLDVNYRFHKKFEGNYIDKNRIERKKVYSLFVRDLDKGIKTSVNRMGELLWKKNLYKGKRFNEAPFLRTICANKLYEETAKIIKKGDAINFLYEIEK